MWRHQVFARKLTWYFIGVYIMINIVMHRLSQSANRYASEVLNKNNNQMQASIIIFFFIFTDCLSFVKYVYEVSNELQMKRCFRSSVSWSLTVTNIYWLRKKIFDLHNHNTSLTTLYLYFNQFAPEPPVTARADPLLCTTCDVISLNGQG